MIFRCARVGFCLLAILAGMGVSIAASSDIHLSDAQALTIGKRIWKNECAGTVSGLTSWNKGENFASLGIGHFIWYPAGKPGPFEESFPKLVVFLKAKGQAVPHWLEGACVWNTREEFMHDFESARMVELRGILEKTIALQARFAALRLEQALDKMLKAAPASERQKVQTNFYRVATESLGFYALMDYVNFKGEGTSPTERYNGQGWGLLQVLERMPTTGPAVPAFADAAAAVLTQRVKNSPPARHEAQWLPGWKSRLHTYMQ
ncbi:MAG: hypothetical protein ABI443_03645 [Chthoniobacterales bacterium]